MAWITLALRKQELKAEITNYDNRLIQISREVRRIARHKMYEQSVFNSQKQQELQAARQGYLSVRDSSPLTNGMYGNNNNVTNSIFNNNNNLYGNNGNMSGVGSNGTVDMAMLGEALNAATTALTNANNSGNNYQIQQALSAFNTAQSNFQAAQNTMYGTNNGNINGFGSNNNNSIINSDAYQSWQQSYANAREDYQLLREQINDKYDAYSEDLEAEASDMQADLEQEQVETETILADLRAEYESVSEQAKEEIKNSAIDFGS